MKDDSKDKVAVAAGVSMLGCFGFAVLLKLAFWVAVVWGIFELVSWVITK